MLWVGLDAEIDDQRDVTREHERVTGPRAMLRVISDSIANINIFIEVVSLVELVR